MNIKSQNISSLQEISEALTSEIESLNKDLEAVKSLINRFSGNGHVPESKALPLAKSKVTKTKKAKSENSNSGKEKLSGFMFNFLKQNWEKDFDIASLSDAVIEAIQSGKVAAPAGKVKDEVGKRLYQFRNRGDVAKTIQGTYQYADREKFAK